MSGKKEHVLLPRHELLSDAAAKQVLKELNTTIDKLPKILASDPQALALNAKPGQIIAIDRNDNGVSYKFYRVVVE
ncbi:MAG: DNA-directed RNA polymerase subunit RpoH/Rpb5 C-terminal domain-containing protein [Candidatus Micrarchaeaceae archaeon]